MPRNRMVKSTFWVEEAVVSCSQNARLLYIGMWNFCDDSGIHPVSYLTLKMEVFPGDNCSIEDIKKWISELISHGLVREYAVNNKSYWIVLDWGNRQTINRPTPSPYPPPESGCKQISHSSNLIESSVNPHSSLNDDSVSNHVILTPNIKESKIREENIKEEDIVINKTNSFSPPLKNCPQEEIKALYEEILPMCRQTRIWNETRARLLRGVGKKTQSINP